MFHWNEEVSPLHQFTELTPALTCRPKAVHPPDSTQQLPHLCAPTFWSTEPCSTESCMGHLYQYQLKMPKPPAHAWASGLQHSDLTLLHGPPRTMAFTSLLIPNKKRQKKQAMQISLHLDLAWESSTQGMKAEYQAAHELVQQELWWNPLPSPRQFNKRETEAAKQLLTSVLKDTPWRQAPSRSSWIVLSTCGTERRLSPPPQHGKSCWQELSLDLSKWLLGYLPCPSFSKHHVTKVSPLLQA